MEIGDRVVAIQPVGNAEYETIGIKGWIRNTDIDGLLLVEFDESIDGHDGGGLGKYGHCWWCDTSEIEKCEEDNAVDEEEIEAADIFAVLGF